MDLADMLIQKGALKNPLLIEAFRRVDRKNFVPEAWKDYAYVDEPLSIGEGQTISQPWTVAFMLELLDLPAGRQVPLQNIMEIGYGSGWQTALLASVGANVYAIERIPSLCKFGEANVRNSVSNTLEVRFYCQDGTLGLPEIAEHIGGFDKIIVAAAASAAPTSRRSYFDSIPPAWQEQLKVGGKIVAPIEHSIFEFIKKPDGSFEEIEHPGFAFVPLVTNHK